MDSSLVVSAGGVRVLVQGLSDGPYELADTLVIAFLYLLDMPETRQYVRPGHDLEVSQRSRLLAEPETNFLG